MRWQAKGKNEEYVMIVEYIRYRVPEGTSEAFEEAYERAGKWLSASEHCLGYEVTRCEEEPVVFMVRIEWDSPEGHLEGFRKSPEFLSFFGEVKPYVSAIQEMRHYRRTRVYLESKGEGQRS
jgi:quinol monooxygenase YgiN